MKEPHPLQHLQTLVHLKGEAGVEEEEKRSPHLLFLLENTFQAELIASVIVYLSLSAQLCKWN